MFCCRILTIGFIWMLSFQIKVSFLVKILLFLFRLDKRDLHVKILKCLFENSWKVLFILSENIQGFFINISQSLNTSGIFSIGYFSAERKKVIFLKFCCHTWAVKYFRKRNIHLDINLYLDMIESHWNLIGGAPTVATCYMNSPPPL